MARKPNQVIARYRPIDRVSPGDVLKMYSIFQRYYENADIDTFLRDMSRKTGVFLMLRRDDKEIVGFSTVAKMDLTIGGKAIKGVFSGDTIIEQEYWGSRALPLAFFMYLLRTVLRHPLTPVFWLLISKGYKTYLLLNNNFFRFYPHPENRYQEYRPLVEEYCERLFPGYFDPQRGVLDFGHDYQRLKADVAPITDEMRAANKAIAFFEACNPEWRRGTELPCVGRAGFPDALRYPFYFFAKLRRKKAEPLRAAVAVEVMETAPRSEPQRVSVPVKIVESRQAREERNASAALRSS